ncbi:MAG: hypothetical protein Roseis2KO_14470 [Roseivirga sp.]
MKRIEILSMAYLYVLFMSFMPLLVKGMLHVQGGSYVPMIVINLLGLPIIYGLYFGKPWVTFFIRIWSVWLMIYGIARVLLQVLIELTSAGIEANIANQVTFGYLCMSLLHLTVGWVLYRYLYSCVWVADKEPRLAV